MHHVLTSTRKYTYNCAVFLCGVQETVSAASLPFSFQEDCQSFKGAANAAPHIEITKKPNLVISFSKKSFLAIHLCCNQ